MSYNQRRFGSRLSEWCTMSSVGMFGSSYIMPCNDIMVKKTAIPSPGGIIDSSLSYKPVSIDPWLSGVRLGQGVFSRSDWLSSLDLSRSVCWVYGDVNRPSVVDDVINSLQINNMFHDQYIKSLPRIKRLAGVMGGQVGFICIDRTRSEYDESFDIRMIGCILLPIRHPCLRIAGRIYNHVERSYRSVSYEIVDVPSDASINVVIDNLAQRQCLQYFAPGGAHPAVCVNNVHTCVMIGNQSVYSDIVQVTFDQYCSMVRHIGSSVWSAYNNYV